jgi:hypothetical protein
MLGRVARRAIGMACAIALLSAGGALAAAGGAGTTTMTVHEHETEIFSFPAANPCNGEPGMITTLAKNSVFHVTEQADGDKWLTGTANGTVTFTPENPSGISASGHFTAWFGEADNNKNSVEHSTTTFHLVASDGSRIDIHMGNHIGTNGKGELVTARASEKPHLQCV